VLLCNTYGFILYFNPVLCALKASLFDFYPYSQFRFRFNSYGGQCSRRLTWQASSSMSVISNVNSKGEA